MNDVQYDEIQEYLNGQVSLILRPRTGRMMIVFIVIFYIILYCNFCTEFVSL